MAADLNDLTLTFAAKLPVIPSLPTLRQTHKTQDASTAHAAMNRSRLDAGARHAEQARH